MNVQCSACSLVLPVGTLAVRPGQVITVEAMHETEMAHHIEVYVDGKRRSSSGHYVDPPTT
jgi:hypothetical protein